MLHVAKYYEETKEERRARIQAEKRRLKHLLRIIAVFVLVLAVLVIALGVLLVKSRLSTSSVGTTAESGDFSFTYVGEATQQNSTADGEEGAAEQEQPKVLPIPEISGEGLHSDYALMVRLTDDAVIFSKDPGAKVFPASLFKLMTALVAVESGTDLLTPVTVTQAHIDQGYLAGATLAGFAAGEMPSLEELIYGVLLPSGSEACYAIADEVAGGEEAFVERMNQKAKDLGMTNSHFANCTGLHDEQNYTTCEDLAILMKECLKKSTIRRALASEDFTTTPTAQHPDGLYMQSTMFEALVEKALGNGVTIQGGKTGTTDEAGKCLASFAVSGNDTYILITTHAPETAETSNPNVVDAVSLYSQLPVAG